MLGFNHSVRKHIRVPHTHTHVLLTSPPRSPHISPTAPHVSPHLHAIHGGPYLPTSPQPLHISPYVLPTVLPMSSPYSLPYLPNISPPSPHILRTSPARLPTFRPHSPHIARPSPQYLPTFSADRPHIFPISPHISPYLPIYPWLPMGRPCMPGRCPRLA